MPEKKSKKINPIWYILPAIEIIGFFLPANWFGAGGSILVSLVIFASSIASIVGFFLIRRRSLSIALLNLIIGVIVLILFVVLFLVGLLGALGTT